MRVILKFFLRVYVEERYGHKTTRFKGDQSESEGWLNSLICLSRSIFHLLHKRGIQSKDI